MLMGITWRDKWLDEQKGIDGTDFTVGLAGYPIAFYAGCGLV